jgi:membrane protease YdiL (CAAX protease family)
VSKQLYRPRHPLLVIPWTYGLFILANLGQYAWMGAAVAATGSTFGEIAGGDVRTHVTVLLRGVVGLAVGLPLTILVARHLWRRDRSWLWLDRRYGLLARGALLGLAAPLPILGILVALGAARVTGGPGRLAGAETASALVGFGMWALFKAGLEELIVRGMATRELVERLGWARGTVAGGVYFGAMHLVNVLPILTPLLAVRILLGGACFHLLLVTLLRRAGSLWLPIGFHAGWNVCLSALVGAVVSGGDGGLGLYMLELRGAPWLTGGEFGLELSAVSIVAYAAAAALVGCSLRGRQARAPATGP